MEEDIVIKVDHVTKVFQLPYEKNNSIKSAVVHLGRHNTGYEKQLALNDVSFDVKKGEFFGIVGRNGSGKSTLLKMLAGIYSPSKGTIQINGRLTPFIELGVGFNPELTGRENVYLNGALLGFNRKEVNDMYQDIVDFAEIPRFMDQKLKNYSSGMQVRLAFSIAIRARSDILILDEVLAVGDEAFQQKCISIFEKYKAQRQTVILVTHDMGVVQRFCSRALMLTDGEVVKIGTPRIVSQMYSDSNKDAYATQKQLEETSRSYSADIKIQILDAKTKQPKKRFLQQEELLVRLSWERNKVENAGIAIMKQSGEYIFGPNTYRDKQAFHDKKELYYTARLNLAPGEYFLKAGLFGKKDRDVLEFVDEGPSFMVDTISKKTVWGGLTNLPHAWGDDNVKL